MRDLISRFLLLGLLLALGTCAQLSQTVTALAPLEREEAKVLFYVQWHITANGGSSEASEDSSSTTTQQISIVGSAVVRQKQDGLLETLPFTLRVNDDTYTLEVDPCQRRRTSVSIIDPERYMGGPDPFWVIPGTFLPQQRSDAEHSWYMADPFNNSFYANGDLLRTFTYRWDVIDQDTCTGEEEHNTFTLDALPYANLFNPPNSKPLEGDPSGTVFTRDDDYTIDFVPYRLNVHFTATVHKVCSGVLALLESGKSVTPQALRQVCGCSALPLSEVIDASDPIITNLELWPSGSQELQVQPDGMAKLTFGVTCEGRLVKNAEVEVTVKPESSSGGHTHAGVRPRGYLNGTEITDAKPSIKVISDPLGIVTVQFEPGKDQLEHKRGIAGLYIVKTRSTRFPYARQGVIGIPVAFPGLDKLGPSANYTLYKFPNHPSCFYGTPTTLDAIRQFTDDFRRRQNEHNIDLEFYGKPEWPIVPPAVYAISLQDGGLFDLGYGNQWRPPYYEHRTGHDVTFFLDIADFEFPGVHWKAARAWLEREFKRLGEQVGGWTADGFWPSNLTVGQGDGASLVSAGEQATQTPGGPDLAVSAFLSDPFEQYYAGAGQMVTYTLSVENLVRDTMAHDVILTAILPTGLNLVNTLPAATRMAAPNQPVWDIGTLAAQGVPTIFDVVVQVDASVAPGTRLAVTAQASMSEIDMTPPDNEQETFGLLVQPTGADLVAGSTIAATAMTPGQPVSFTIDVVNRGNRAAMGTVLSLKLPASATLSSALPAPISGSTSEAHWQLGSVAPDSSKQVSVSVFLEPSLLAFVSLDPESDPQRILSFRVEAGSDTADFDLSNNVEQVAAAVQIAGSDLSVAFSTYGAGRSGMLSAGQELTYTIFYGNAGNQVAATTSVTLSLWAGLELMGAQPQPDHVSTSTRFGGGVAMWNTGELAVGEYGTIHAYVHVNRVSPEGSLVVAKIDGGPENQWANNLFWEQRTQPSAVISEPVLYLPRLGR